MCTTVILLVQPKGYLEPRNKVQSQSMLSPPVGFESVWTGGWQGGIATNKEDDSVTELLPIELARQFLIIYSGFSLVNILLQIFAVWSQKRHEKEKNTF